MSRNRILDYDKIRKLHGEGMSTRAIARELGTYGHSVADALRRMNIEPRPKQPTLDYKKIKEMYSTGMSGEKIANELGYSKFGVYGALRRMGVDIRTGAKRTDTIRRLGFEPTREWLEKLLTDFGTVAEASRNHGIPYNTLIDHFHRFDVTVPDWHPHGPNINRQDIPIKEAIQLSNSGVPYRELAETYEVSYGVIMRRMKEAGHQAPRNKHRQYDPRFETVSMSKRRVLNELGIKVCEICGEGDVLDYCHIVADKDGGPIAIDNCLVLCPNHHRKYHSSKLSRDEMIKITKKVRKAKRLYAQ